MQARHEYKLCLNYGDYLSLKSRLRAAMAEDIHAGPDGGYLVRSLYFDTPQDKALREKLDGVNRREKFRIRRYDDDTQTLFLEKKSKIGGLCYKRAEQISPEEFHRIMQGDWSWMVQGERPLVLEFYSKLTGQILRPKTVISYYREPFVCIAGNTRVTLDRDVHTGLRCTDFLDNGMPVFPSGAPGVLLEVKYDAFLPEHVADLLRVGCRRAEACSKYAYGRIYG